MKPSRYNHFFKLETGITLAFNSASGALAGIEKEHWPRIETLMENCDHAETAADREFVDGLIEGGYLVADNIDEIDDLQKRSQSLRYQGQAFMLTIAPTLACNFKCDYCFESQSRTHMTEETEKALLEFSEQHLRQAKKMIITWFGGEPTIQLKTIERLQLGLRLVADKHGVEAEPASIITNGYLLDSRMAKHLKDIGIALAQITLDGPEEVHNKRRKLRDGRGTFKRIVDNICETADILQIAVRINIDRGNVESAYRVIEELDNRKVLSKVDAHFARVGSSGSSCADIRDRCFNYEEFSKKLVILYQKLFNRGVHRVDYPQVHGGVFCGAVSDHSFVVSPTGDLFNCWEELSLDKEKSIGTVYNEQLESFQEKTLEGYRDWNPFQMRNCRDCDILPICMGGCPLHSLSSGNKDIGVCASWKFNLKEMLELRYRCQAYEEVSE
jgi:uncharacterized protein